MDDERPYDGPPYDPIDISSLGDAHQRHIIALGLIADRSAELESFARYFVGVTIGMTDDETVNALFLGERFGTLQRRLGAMAELTNDGFHKRFSDWAKMASKAMEQRDELIHRPVIGNRLMPARRKQVPMNLGYESTNLVASMDHLLDLAYDLAIELQNPSEFVASPPA